MVQWLRLCASNAGDTGSIPGQGTKIPHAAQHKGKKKTNVVGQLYLNKIGKDKLQNFFLIFSYLLFLMVDYVYFLIYLFIYLFMAVLGLRFCARAFSSCGERGPLFIAVRRSLTVPASLIAEHRLQTRRLSSCGSRAQLLRGMWDLPRPGLEPVSPALAGRFLTTAPPGKPQNFLKNHCKCLFPGFDTVLQFT